MKRDLELIRAILLKLEQTDYAGGQTSGLKNFEDEPYVKGWSASEIAYNYQLMVEGGLVLSRVPQISSSQLFFNSITWSGHDFLDSVRDPEIWRKTKAVTEKAGSTSFGIVKEVAVELAKELVKGAIGTVLGL